MGNIVGNNPHKKIVDQINIRQGALGLTQRPSDVLTWIANNTPWIRVCSTVSVSPEKSKELTGSENYSGRKLAQNFILGGGVYSTDEINKTLTPKAGVSNTKNPINNFAYGFDDLFGLQPPPGIESVDIKSLTRGSIKKAGIKLRANSLEQFNVIEALFLRLGYYIFVEFGHSAYLNNDGKYESPSTLTTPFQNIVYGKEEGKFSAFDILRDLENERKNFEGNYDGFLGKVTNFKWNFNPAGYYDIEIDLYAMGDVAESFKINIPGKDKSGTNTELNLSKKNNSKFSDFLTNLKREAKSNSFTKIKRYENDPGSLEVSKTDKCVCIKLPKQSSKKSKDYLYYITLKDILEYLRNELLVYTKEQGKESIPLIDIDFDSENYCYTHPYQFSSDPNVCLIPFTRADSSLSLLGDDDFINSPTLLKTDFLGEKYWDKIIGSNFRDTENNFIGNLMSILVNVDMLIELINNTTEEKPTITLYDFLSKIMDKIKYALGDINKFDITFNNDTQKLTITDTVLLADFLPKNENNNDKAIFNVYGVKKDIAGSFLTNVGLQCTVPKNMTAMIVAGAQANGNNKTTNATAFSKWNEGLIDTLAPIKVPKEQLEESGENKKNTNPFADNDLFTAYLEDSIIQPFYTKSKTISEEQIKSSYSNSSTFINQVSGFITQLKKGAPNPNGFIPLTLDLDMMGLSGIKIYDRIFITNDILPSNYPKNLAFIVKGISHKVSSKGWETKLDTFSYDVPEDITSNLPSNQYLEKNPR